MLESARGGFCRFSRTDCAGGLRYVHFLPITSAPSRSSVRLSKEPNPQPTEGCNRRSLETTYSYLNPRQND